ncbi:MAG: UDP-N-acetylmuramoyl-tripeptide--D-alanyl-D-alanine ligase [Spirochaetales bacterium]|nr:UDP-N-acetylmuramoyl-tripeptide--D-alanyl-D-alanine ligase [Spirochaetales bacterium]
MKTLFTAREITDTVNGRRLFGDESAIEVSSVSVDSRKVEPKGCFIALHGEKTDGHRFLSDAVNGGAAVLIIEKKEAGDRETELKTLFKDHGVSIIAVEASLKALQALARFHLDRMSGLTRIGITGSNGKTTTKEIIGSVLKGFGNTVINEGNLNSDIGLPLSAFNTTGENKFGVFEMGMNRKGEMDELADVLNPDMALITNIGTAHIGLLGSRDGIAAEKKKIFKNFNGSQTGFLNENEAYFNFLSKGVQGKIVSFGLKSTRGIKGYDNLGLDGFTIDWEGLQIHFPLPGFHNLLNVTGALAIARELGVPPAAVKDGLEAVTALFARSQIFKGPVTIIMDCYNANPESMQNAVDFFKELPWSGRKVAILGSMRELGEDSQAAHAGAIKHAKSCGFDQLLLFGEEMEPASSNGTLAWTDNYEELERKVRSLVRPGDLVLLKGSRGVELERLLPVIRKLA